MEERVLKTDGWLTEENTLTDKSTSFLEFMESSFVLKSTKQKKIVLGAEALEKVTEYKNIFPPGKLPSGVPSRINERELERKFQWFFATYPEFADWDLIHKAAKNYVEEYRPVAFFKMRNSGYFVQKTDMITKQVTSDLATYCEMVRDMSEEEATEEYIAPQHRVV